MGTPGTGLWEIRQSHTVTGGRPEQGQVYRLPTARRDGPGPGWQSEGPTENSSAPDPGGGERKLQISEKGRGNFLELQMGDLPRNKRVKITDLVFCAEQA